MPLFLLDDLLRKNRAVFWQTSWKSLIFDYFWGWLKEFFSTCNVLPFSCTHVAWQDKRPKIHAKRKGFKNFFLADHNFLKIFKKYISIFFLIKAKDDNEDKGMYRYFFWLITIFIKIFKKYISIFSWLKQKTIMRIMRIKVCIEKYRFKKLYER